MKACCYMIQNEQYPRSLMSLHALTRNAFLQSCQSPLDLIFQCLVNMRCGIFGHIFCLHCQKIILMQSQHRNGPESVICQFTFCVVLLLHFLSC